MEKSKAEYREDYKKHILSCVEDDLNYSDDGYYHYFGSGHGYLSADALRIIADELDRRNEDWDKQMKEHSAP